MVLVGFDRNFDSEHPLWSSSAIPQLDGRQFARGESQWTGPKNHGIWIWHNVWLKHNVICVLVFQKTCLQTQIQCSGAFGRDYGTHQRWLSRRKCSNCLKTMVWADFVVERCWWCRVELTKCPRTSDAFRRTIMLLGSVFSRAFGQSQDVPNPWLQGGKASRRAGFWRFSAYFISR